MLQLPESSKNTSSNTPFSSAAKLTFYSFLSSLILGRVWTEVCLLESTWWEQQARSKKVSPNCCTSVQFLPAKTTLESKTSSLLAKNISLYKQLQCKIECHRGEETFSKKWLTSGIYLGRHQWDFLRGKETFCELNVYLLCGSRKLGVYSFKQQQKPIHLFLPDCPCFFWHVIPWKWLQWSATGGPGDLIKQVEAFVSQVLKTTPNGQWLCWLREYNAYCCILLFLIPIPQNIEIRLK